MQHLIIYKDEYEMLKGMALSPEKYRKIVFLDENGKPEEALAKKQRLVSALKKDFRKEIDI